MNLYLKRIEAYNGTCVKGAVDPATGYLLGDIEPVGMAARLEWFARFRESGPHHLLVAVEGRFSQGIL